MAGIWKVAEEEAPERIWDQQEAAAGGDLRIIRGDGWVVGVEPDTVDLRERQGAVPRWRPHF